VEKTPELEALWTVLLPKYSGDKIKKNVMGGACRTCGGTRGAYRVLVGRPEGKKPLGRPRRRWEDKIKMNIQGVGWGDMDWIDLAQDRDRWQCFVNAVMNLRVPQNAGCLLSS
jgi:hypothetical protein